MPALQDAYDYVIVGGGSAGCVLANRLSADPAVTVCLLEAGPSDWSPLVHVPVGILAMLPSRHCNYAYETVPQPGLGGRRGYQPRGRVLGGSSSINAMIYMRGHRRDYDDWAALGNAGWSYADVLPWFKNHQDQARGADAFHGTGGELTVSDLTAPNPASLAFVEAAVRAGHRANPDFNGADQSGVGLFQVTQRRGRRCSAAVAFLRPVADRPNLTILTGAIAERVRLAGQRATGVDCRVRGRAMAFAARREVIVAAGTFGSPQLLQLSGIGPRDVLEPLGVPVHHELPGVGDGLADHVDIALAFRSSDSRLYGFSGRAALAAIRGGWDLLRDDRGYLTSNFAEAGVFLSTRPGLDRPDIQLHFVAGMVDDHARNLHWGHGLACHVGVLRPVSRGRVAITSRDPRVAPAIDPGFLTADADVATLLAGVRAAREILATGPLAGWLGAELEAPVNGTEAAAIDQLRRRADSIYHPVGTCRMGSDERAVVDTAGRVRGVESLRVIDASIFPALVGGNTNAPTLMVADRIAAGMTGAAGRAG